ncbi:MAG: zinc-binding dehydrogenase [Verrucomicrobia bacterium]|nr:zinc-binding dehydrogenase [Verrucomicrobiota bacterium]
MQAACLVAPRTFELQEVSLAALEPNEIRFQVELCGVCASNLGPWRGAPWFTYPFAPGAPGHEAIGTVVETGGAVQGFRPGDRVATLAQNGFAEYDRVDAGSALVLPEGIRARPFLGEPLACAVNVIRRAVIRQGDWVAVVGLGFLGTLLIQLVRARGGRAIGVSSRAESRRLAEQLGAEATVGTEDRARVIEQVNELTSGQLCPVVIEAAGYQSTLDLCTEITGVRGRLLIAGYHQDGPRTVNLQLWNWRGLDVINAHEREHAVYVDGMREALRLFLDGTLHLEGLITHYVPMAELNRAFHLAEERPAGFLKAAMAGRQ